MKNQEKDNEKHFERQRNRYQRLNLKKDAPDQQSRSVSNSASDYKLESLTDRPKVHTVISSFTQKPTTLLTPSSQQALKKIINVNKTDFAALLKDKAVRLELKKEERRLTKMRNDQKMVQQSQLQLSFLAINGLLSVSEETITEFIKQKQPKPKTMVRVNQEKQMSKQLAIIDEQIAANNYVIVKNSIQGLLKRFGKDEFLEAKVPYLTYMQTVTQQLERQSNILRECTAYLQKLSTIDTSSPENMLAGSSSLKNMKKELNVAVNKQSKKAEPNARTLTYLGQFDKLATTLSAFIDPKIEKKPVRTQNSASKQLQAKNQGSEFLQEANKYLKQLLQKTSEDKQTLYKQLQVLKRNKKKSAESPYSFVIRLFDLISNSKREVNEFNNYLKSLTQLSSRKNLSSQNWAVQAKKIQEKFSNNQVFATSKPNLDSLISSVQQKQRSGQNLIALEQEARKLRQENEKLLKVNEEQRAKLVQKMVEDQKIDKKKELQERRLKEAEKIKTEKFERELEKSIETIFSNLAEKKYKIAKNSINVFIKKYEQMPNPIIPKSIQSFNVINTLITDLETQQTLNSQFDRRQKAAQKQNEKQKELFSQKLKAYEEYEGFLKAILENFSEEKYILKKVFDDLRRDRKKIIQERYLLLVKLEDLISFWRNNKKNTENQNKSASLQLSVTVVEGEKVRRELAGFEEKFRELESKSAETTKDIQQLLSLIKKIESGGQWWKFIPRNLKNNSTFKPVYGILQQYRKYQLNIEALKTKENLSRGEAQPIENAIDYINHLIQKDSKWIGEDQWEKKLINFKGKQGYEKLLKCLKLLSFNATLKINEQSVSLKQQVDRLERQNSDRQRSNSQIEESQSKKSNDMRSSRKSSRSRDRGQGKNKQILETYIEDERKYLSRIDESQRQKLRIKQQLESTQLKARALQQELFKSEERCVELEVLKIELQKQKYRQFNQINNLKGELEIAEDRMGEIQIKLEAELNQYKQLYDTVSLKITESAAKTKKLEDQNSTLKKEAAGEGSASKQRSNEKKPAQQVMQKMEGIKYKINLDTQKVFDLVETDANLRQKARRRLQSMKKSGKKEESPKQQEQADSASQQPSSQFNYEMDLMRQKEEYFISQNNRLLLIITDLTTQNNALKIQLQNLLATTHQNQTYLGQIERLKVEISKLALIIDSLKRQHKELMEIEVREARKKQADDFAVIQAEALREQEQYFLTVMLPERVREQAAKISNQQRLKSPEKVQPLVLDIDSEQFLNLYGLKIQQDHINFQNRLEIEIQNHMSQFMTIELPAILQKTRNEMQLQFNLMLENQRKLRVQPENSPDFLQLKEEYTHLRNDYQIFKAEKQNELRLAVEAAVLREVQNFNAFLATHQKEQQNYYLNIVLPQKISEQLIKRSPVKQQSYQLDINSEQFLHLYAIKSQAQRQELQLRIENELRGAMVVQFQQQLSMILQSSRNEWMIQYENDRIMWELIKADEWKAREIVIANYWLSLLEQKEREWYFRLQKQSQTNQVQRAKVEVKLTEVELMEMVSRREYSNVIGVLIENARMEWQSSKEAEILHLRQSIAAEWQTVIVPKLKSEWQVSKNEEIKLIVESNRNNHPEVIIQQWKSMFLDSILDYERTNAVALFKQVELPKILSAEKEKTDIIHRSLIEQNEREWNRKSQDLEATYSAKLQQQVRSALSKFETELRRNLQVQFRRSLEIQLRNTLYLQIKNKVINESTLSLQQSYNNRLAVEHANWQKAKQQEIVQILEIQVAQWEKHKQNQITFILTNERNAWEAAKQQEIATIINEQRSIWAQHQIETIEKTINEESAKWQLIIKQKDDELTHIKAVDVEESMKVRLIEMQKEYHEVRIPQILQHQYQLWITQSQRTLEAERQNWLKELPQLLNTEAYSIYLQNYRQKFSAEYEQRVRNAEANLIISQRRNQQLLSELSQSNQKYSQLNLHKEQLQQTIVKIRAEHNHQIHITQTNNIKLSQSGAISKEADEFRKIVARQNQQLRNMEVLARQNARLKQQNLQLRETASAFQSSKWREINQVRNQFELKIIELSSERTTLINRIHEVQTTRHTSTTNQTMQSLQRQIATLEATLRTKDTEIAFLKRAIDTNKDELRQSRQQYALLFESKGQLQKQMTEIKNSKLEIEYEIRFLAQREQSLKKKLETREQEVVALRKKQSLQADILEKKAKNSLEAVATYQLKITELQSVFTLKSQECQAALIEVDRLRFQLQRSEANTHAIAYQLQNFKHRVRDTETQLLHVRSQKERILEDLSKLKNSLNQHMAKEQDLNKQLLNQSRMTKQTEGERMRIEAELLRLNNQISQLLRDLSENERVARRQAEKAVQLQRQLVEVRSVVRGVDPNEIEVLSKINNQVTQLTATNRQLTMKILLLENRDKILNFSADVMNFFLLIQKHTDYLLDHLLKEGIIPNLQPYHRFLAESRPYIVSGQLPIYFAKWETLLRQLFDIALRSRAEQLRSQAQQLLRLKEQMNEVLQRQIEASESDAGQLVEDYKLVLMDIKSLVKEYVSSGDRQYLSLLCSSLGLSMK